MKTNSSSRLWLSLAFLALLTLGATVARSQTSVAPIVPFTVSMWYPTNGETYAGPTNIGVHARVIDSNVVETVQYFSGITSLGLVSNKTGVMLTNSTSDNPFYLAWSNVAPGGYTLTAVATDSSGNTATSAPVTIKVTPPPPVPFTISFWYPTNGETFVGPTNIGVHALVLDSNLVETVQYFAGTNSIGLLSNKTGVLLTNSTSGNPFEFAWSNVPPGSYSLTAVAVDSIGDSVTSAPVNITVTQRPAPPPAPFAISMWYPTNGETYVGPTNIGVHALVTDSNLVDTVQYFSGTNRIGIVSNTTGVMLTNTTSDNPFYMSWSNVAPGSYTLMAVATDSTGNTATSAAVNITVISRPPPPPAPFTISMLYPTNSETFAGPTNITLRALVTDSNLVDTVQYFSGTNSIGIASNTTGVILTNATSENPFYLTWSNVVPGSYTLIGVATDSAGNTATSAPVNITVTSRPPPPSVPFVVSMLYPTNGETFVGPTNIGVHALVIDSNIVETVQYFAGTNSIGTVSNTAGVVLTNTTSENPFFMVWSNVAPGSYTLTSVATDSVGNTATSTPVNITVTSPPPPPPVPFSISLWYPTNGETYVGPTNIGVHARVTDSNLVETVQYFSGATSIGIVSNTASLMLTNSTSDNPFFLNWSNVAVGSYTITAVATDSSDNTATSARVNIVVVPPPPSTVTIYAPDPVAVEGTNFCCMMPPTAVTNYCTGTNTATFLVRRVGGTNVDLTVDYSIGGSATNGVDYETIPSNVTIPAGQSYALITIVPLQDTNVFTNSTSYKTVILTLLAPPTAYGSSATYSVGSPQHAGAVILEDKWLPILDPIVRSLDGPSVHVSLPGTNGMNFCVQTSTNLIDWVPICTNTVLKGSAQFVDPDGSVTPNLFYRVVPVVNPASY